jgi:hypothetical protein
MNTLLLFLRLLKFLFFFTEHLRLLQNSCELDPTPSVLALLNSLLRSGLQKRSVRGVSCVELSF